MTPAELAERALAQHTGTGDLIVVIDRTVAAHLRWAAGAVTAAGAVDDTRISVMAVHGRSVGALSHVGALDDEELHDLVAGAERIAHHAPADPSAEPLLTAQEEVDDAPADHPEPPTAAIRSIADELAESARLLTATRRASFGYAQQRVRTTSVASTAGLRRAHVSTSALLDLSLREPDGGAGSWTGAAGPDLAGLGLRERQETLGHRLDSARRVVGLPPGRHELILAPSCVADLMVRLYLAAGAQDALDGNSVFAATDGTRLGERLSELPITVRSNPEEPGLLCRPFTVVRSPGSLGSVFDTGAPLAPTRWIDRGVLSALVQTRHSARVSRRPLTPWIGNLVMEAGPGGRNLDEMVRGSTRALLVTSLWYLREVNPMTLTLTGVTRDGVYLVEDGQVVGAVRDFRINESPVALMSRITEVGLTTPTLPREWTDVPTRVAMPAVRVPDVAVS
ncbi:metallopeptidase TldD-related protein [Winogradskya humida]|uniref:Peptidase n=1 Tax=Winogradskya humida TaxID=113566 RepID=A0ABQ4A7Z9_9ACTN|nr:metallopeptidase TldD-related protein [Actinoplanes humidus]GIE26829.1 peptidase [Actinoplanes humidus]